MTTEDNNNETPNVFDELKQLIGMDFHMEIKDGVFCITPAEAAIALFSATSEALFSMEKVSDEIDAIREDYLNLKNETDEHRQMLEACYDSYVVSGFDFEATCLENYLWPVTGILEDGTEIVFKDTDNFENFLENFHKHIEENKGDDK